MKHNVEKFRIQFDKLDQNFMKKAQSSGPFNYVNNLDFYEGMSMLTFMRDIAKHFRVSSMLARDSVKSRIGDENEGISFTEFSY